MSSVSLPTSKQFRNLTDQEFDRLTVKEFLGYRKIGGTLRSVWRCDCSCGNVVEVASSHITTHHTKSCGCWKKDKPGAATHGMAHKHPLYDTWKRMRQRCFNKKSNGYKDYGGRGVTVHESLLTFPGFLAEIEKLGDRPPNTTLDRFPDNNGDYAPGNLRWATSCEQAHNKRNNRLLTVAGVTACLAVLSRLYGISRSTASFRLRTGWSVDDAFKIPVGAKRSRRSPS